MFKWFRKKKKNDEPTPALEVEALESSEEPVESAPENVEYATLPPVEEAPVEATLTEDMIVEPAPETETAMEESSVEAVAVEVLISEEFVAEPAALPEEVAETPVLPEEVAETPVLPEEVAETPVPPEEIDEATELSETEADENQKKKKGFFGRLREKLSATREKISGRIENLLSSVRTIDEDLLDELEEILITSDLGTKTTTDLLFKIRGQVRKKELKDADALKAALKSRLTEMINLPLPPASTVKPYVIMVVGINGVGKTTTIAKLAKRYKDAGQKVLLAAGDTFRSAAVDQLAIWADRLGCDIVAQPTGADPSAVVFDALTAAQARQTDVVIIDTAGRLHTKVNLMDELKKIKRVSGKALEGAPHHTVLVVDANTGQNALKQAQTFHEAVGLDAIIMTKLDGTSKGGVIVSICNELKVPISHIGLGESFEDLRDFQAENFAEAIIG